MDVRSEDGQSLLEFLMMFPLLLGLVFTLLNVNTAIQIAIVNQQYAREMALFLTFNSPFYPENSPGKMRQRELIDSQTNQMVLGISEEVLQGDDVHPSAPFQMITRKKNPGGSNENQTEPPYRSIVRVRNTVTLCTPTWYLGVSGQTPISFNNMPSPTNPSTCGGRVIYEQ